MEPELEVELEPKWGAELEPELEAADLRPSWRQNWRLESESKLERGYMIISYSHNFNTLKLQEKVWLKFFNFVGVVSFAFPG